MVGQFLVEGIAQVPAVGEVQAGHRDELRSERMPSKNITSWSLKKTTGSMLGRPRSA